jgi:uncharacterized protein (DUF488 family)
MTKLNHNNSDKQVIYTIGHSNITASALIALLRQYKIQVLVDVRSSPYSQYSPQYNRELLAKTLIEAGVEYRFAGDYLGGRPKDPTCYKTKQLPEGKADYLHIVDYPTVMEKEFFNKGIQRLLDIAKNNRVVIMCSEENPAQCHRHHLIGKYLVGKGINVLHIRADGLYVKDQQLPELPDEPPAKQLSFL